MVTRPAGSAENQNEILFIFQRGFKQHNEENIKESFITKSAGDHFLEECAFS